jgi:crotonobetainyl-CoA:carnitine CoA-transferase CaiB-like acyl-CoA transferase
VAGALNGVRILDLTWGIAGPMGVLLLAEQGADVVKVEPPGGDPFRSMPGYRVWNRSRRSVTIDLKSPEGRELFLRLLDDVDVLAESFRPGVMQRLGLGYDDLADRFPRLVYCSIPGYPSASRHAGRPGYDALVQARSGLQYEQPGWRGGPVFCHMPVPSMATFLLAAIGIATALCAREQTGRGQHVETSLYQGVLAYTTMLWQEAEHGGASFHQMMGKTNPPGVHQTSLYECAKGEWIHAATMNGRIPTRTQEEILGLVVDPASVWTMTPPERLELDQRTREAFRKRVRDELVDDFHAAGLGAEPVLTMAEAFAHPQLIANGMVVTVDDPELGPTTQVGVPITLRATPGAVKGPQPRPGEHNAEVLGALPPATATSNTTSQTEVTDGRARPRRLALEGIRVLDFGQYLAGPYGPMVLAGLGADVIKVEPVRGDGMRIAAKPFVGCQRGKRAIALDIKSPAGLAIAHELVATADVVHHNMTKGVAARIGLDYERLRRSKPDLVYCNTYAYGEEGPLSDFGGLDPLYQAICGLEYEAGAMREGNPPLYIRFGMTDTANALLSTLGVLLALFHRSRTGVGQEVTTSLLNGAAMLSSDVFLTAQGPAPRDRLDRGLHGTGALYRLYRTHDGWLQLAAVTDDHWRALCKVLGRADLVEQPRFADSAARRANRAALEAELEPGLLERPSRQWWLLLDKAGVPCEVPADTNEGETVLHDDENVRLGLVVAHDHARLGLLRQFGELITFSDTPAKVGGPPPVLGQHTREVLSELGRSDADIEALIADGTVAAAEPEGAYPFPC